MTPGWGVVAGLAVTQTIGYGTLYYAFAVVLTPLSAELEVSTTAVTGALTASVLTSAVLAVPVGRWLDRHGGRALMTGGSVASVLLLVAWARVDTLPELYAVQIGIGAATAATLYEAAFAVVIAWSVPERRPRSLLVLTVVAGFASTIFLPLTGWLVSQYGWRAAVLVLAAIHALTVPVHACLVPLSRHRSADGTRRVRASSGAVGHALRDKRFWLLAAGFSAHTAAVSVVAVHLVSALVSWGHPPTFAATIAGLLGMLSVAGRVLATGLQRRCGTGPVTAAVFAAQATAAALLPVVGSSAAGAVAAVTGFGIGFGVATLARPAMLVDRYDPTVYATLAGILVVPMTLAKASAPLGAAVVQTTTGSYSPVLMLTALCCGLAALAIALVRPVPGRDSKAAPPPGPGLSEDEEEEHQQHSDDKRRNRDGPSIHVHPLVGPPWDPSAPGLSAPGDAPPLRSAERRRGLVRRGRT